MKPSNVPFKGYLPTLDGWRAVAASGVIFYHAVHAFWVISDHTFPSPRFYARSCWGAYGVDIFFAISGFLICSRLIEEFKRAGRLSLTSFYIRRAFRILPPAIVYLAVLLVLFKSGLAKGQIRDLVSSLFFFRNYVPSVQFLEWNNTNHFWSLSVEEHFYLLWPGFLALCGIQRARRLVVPLALSIAVWRLMAPHVAIFPNVYLWSRTDVRLDGLLWGCWVALVLDVAEYRQILTRYLSPIALAVLGPALLWSILTKSPMGSTAMAFLLPLVLLCTVLHPDSLLGQVLEWAPIRWFGRISYSVYIWQQVFLDPNMLHYPIRMALMRLPLNVAAILACAVASYYLVERPMTELGRRISFRPGNPERGLDSVALSEAVRSESPTLLHSGSV